MIWRAISMWFGKGLEKLALGAGAVAVFFTMMWRAKTRGKLEERDRQERQRMAEMAEAQAQRDVALKNLQEKKDEIDGLSDDDVARRLHDRWSRQDR